MAAQRPKNSNPLFGQNETMDDLTAEQEELGGGEATPQDALVTATSEDVSPGTSEAAPPAQTATTEQSPTKETGVDRRIKELLEINREKDRQITESNERWARLDERSKQVREAQAAAQRAATDVNPYDKNIDPVGYKEWELEKKIQELEAWKQQFEPQFQQFQQGVQAEQQTTQFNNWVVAEAQNFSRQEPNYMDAARFAVAKRNEFWQELGYDPAQAQQLTMAEANLVTRSAAANGRSFGPAVMKFAQWMGYQPRSGNGNGAVTPAAASQAGKVLAQVAKGQTMQGIGRAPGAGNEARGRYAHMTAAEIASVPDNVWQRDYANPQLRVEMEAALRRLDGIDNEDVKYSTR